jgi:hypothetical protein
MTEPRKSCGEMGGDGGLAAAALQIDDGDDMHTHRIRDLGEGRSAPAVTFG